MIFIKISVIFGGKGSEHDVSIVSGTSVISHLNKDKYDIYPIYIGKDGLFYKYNKKIEDINILKVGDTISELELIDNIIDYLKDIDVIFPVLHGLYGEDGTIQGLFELIGKPYVGCKVLASCICMDKIYAKILFKSIGINTAKSMFLKKYMDKYVYVDDFFNEIYLKKEELVEYVSKYLKFPVFIKPSRGGSSVGVSKAKNTLELINYIEEAFNYDSKVLVEETILGREVECAILGNDDLIVSTLGEVLASDEFYTYEAKYKNSKSRTVIPANIEDNLIEKIKEIAKKAYKVCDCKGLSRIDFFVENDTNKIILNEINTLPGFTNISMYPKLFISTGISYSDIITKLVELGEKAI